MKRENLEYIVNRIMESRGVSLPPVNKGKGDMLAIDQEEGLKIDAEYIEQMIDEMASAALEDGANGFITDLLNCALQVSLLVHPLGEINYKEIANHYQEES